MGQVSFLPAKITKLQNARGGIQEEILGLDVTMADAQVVSVHKGSEDLVHIQLDQDERHGLAIFGKVPGGPIDRLRNILQHQIEVHFILLRIFLCDGIW